MAKSAQEPVWQALLELLNQGFELFSELLQTEERLRDALIKGEARAVAGMENYRVELQRRVAELEEKRKELLPSGVGLGEFITSLAEPGEQQQLLLRLGQIREQLKQLRILQEVNRSLLQERLRFSQELQDFLHSRQEVYDGQGKLQVSRKRAPFNLDRNC